MTTGTFELHPGIASEAPAAGAALGIRLAATAVDAVIVGTVAVVAGLVAHLFLSALPATLRDLEIAGLAALAAVIVTGYFVYYWGREGATPGKRMMGLTLTRTGTLDSQEPIGVGRALLRLVGMAAGSVLFVDLVVALLHRDNRALHDLVADSIVVPAR